MKRFFTILILMLSVFSIASAHPFKSEKELYDFYAEIDKKINEELKKLPNNERVGAFRLNKFTEMIKENIGNQFR